MKIYRIKPEAEKYYSQEACTKQYRIADLTQKRDGYSFIVPVKKNGAPVSFRMEARGVTWAQTEDLIEVAEVAAI